MTKEGMRIAERKKDLTKHEPVPSCFKQKQGTLFNSLTWLTLGLVLKKDYLKKQQVFIS